MSHESFKAIIVASHTLTDQFRHEFGQEMPKTNFHEDSVIIGRN